MTTLEQLLPRLSKAVRLDRANRYLVERTHNVEHVRKTIATNMKGSSLRWKSLGVLVASGQTAEAIKLAAELYACRQFVIGVIEGRLYKMPSEAINSLKKEWETSWDEAFGDLVGKTLKMQD